MAEREIDMTRLSRGQRSIVQKLIARGQPVTREISIALAWSKYPPDEEWTPEHEAELPPFLREE